jgi:hypothetical protein
MDKFSLKSPLSNFTEIRPVGAVLKFANWRTDMKPIGTCGDYANAPTNINPYIGTLFYLTNIVYHFLIASLWYKT